MRRWIFGALVLSGGWLGLAGAASAQQSVFNPTPPVGPYRPALSPYLNLLRGGDSAANYYLGVLPEFDRRYQQSRLSTAVQDLSTRPAYDPLLDDRNDLEVPLRQLPPTGHSAGFMIYNSYYTFPNQRGFLPYNPATTRQLPR